MIGIRGNPSNLRLKVWAGANLPGRRAVFGLGIAFRAHCQLSAQPRLMTPLLDSRKLLAFATLARVGSFTLAARELHLTQSAVSHAIKSLEEDLDLRLFERLGRSVKLTPAGEHLLERAHRILAEMKEARDGLADFVQP
jgi:molybdenum-dependent DNA-binding transcriptional regulator ModE